MLWHVYYLCSLSRMNSNYLNFVVYYYFYCRNVFVYHMLLSFLINIIFAINRPTPVFTLVYVVPCSLLRQRTTYIIWPVVFFLYMYKRIALFRRRKNHCGKVRCRTVFATAATHFILWLLNILIVVRLCRRLCSLLWE